MKNVDILPNKQLDYSFLHQKTCVLFAIAHIYIYVRAGKKKYKKVDFSHKIYIIIYNIYCILFFIKHIEPWDGALNKCYHYY